MQTRIQKSQYNAIIEKPYYEPVGNEIEHFEIAYQNKRPIALVGPTGCGKTTLAMYMAWKIRDDHIRQTGNKEVIFPYIEIPCHEDMTESHLLGTRDIHDNWIEGPLYTAAKGGGMVVLDEIVEARKDIIVLTHSPTDDRRTLYASRKGEVITLPDTFMLVICYNPGYQISSKDLKPSTKQRYPTIIMDYAPPELEKKILMTATGIDEELAERLVTLGNNIRQAKDNASINLQEGASTRLLRMAAEFHQSYVKMGKVPDFREIAKTTIFNPISTNATDRQALESLLDY